MPEQSSTYFTYNEGVEAKHLHLGNLVHDYKIPNDLEPYVEKSYTDVSEAAPEWAHSKTLENFALTLGKAPAEDNDATDGSVEPGSQRYRVVAAAKATRLEIKDPEKFFNENILTSTEAKKWLTSHLSAAESMAQGKAGSRPEIWMLTGLVVMQHATWTILSSKETFTPGLPAPFNPSGVSAIRRVSVSDHVKPAFGFRANDEEKHIPGGHVIHETGKYPGARVWAAQWQKVEAEVLPGEKWKDGVKNQLRLKQFSAAPSKIAVVELDEDKYAENEEEEDDEKTEEFNEEYWDTFLDATDE